MYRPRLIANRAGANGDSDCRNWRLQGKRQRLRCTGDARAGILYRRDDPRSPGPRGGPAALHAAGVQPGHGEGCRTPVSLRRHGHSAALPSGLPAGCGQIPAESFGRGWSPDAGVKRQLQYWQAQPACHAPDLREGSGFDRSRRDWGSGSAYCPARCPEAERCSFTSPARSDDHVRFCMQVRARLPIYRESSSHSNRDDEKVFTKERR